MGNKQFCEHRGTETDLEVFSTFADEPGFDDDYGLSQPLTPPVELRSTPFGSNDPSTTEYYDPRQWDVSFQAEEVAMTRTHKSTASSLFGFRLFDIRGSAVVFSLEPGGLVELFNNRCPDQAIREGDVIVGVNGIAGSCRAITYAVRAGHHVHFTIERAKGAEVEWTVIIDGHPKSAGLEFDTPSQLEGSTLRVAHVSHEPRDRGLASAPLGSHSSSIRRGDVILQVNGEASSALTMAEEMTKAQSSKLRVSRTTVTRAVKFGENLIDDIFSDDDENSDCETPAEPAVAKPFFVIHHLTK
jgi:hypothetical protein